MSRLGYFVVAVVCSAASFAGTSFAHEGHQMKCDAASIRSMKTDVQAMNDGDTKKVAAKEIKLAEDMLSKKDMTGCAAHLSKAMEAIEK